MSLVLIDTSVWARQNQPQVRQVLAEAIEAHAVAMVVPVMLELLRSARDHAELLELAEEYEALHLSPLKPDLGKRARAVQAALARRGYHRGPSPVDLITVSAAESVGAVAQPPAVPLPRPTGDGPPGRGMDRARNPARRRYAVRCRVRGRRAPRSLLPHFACIARSTIQRSATRSRTSRAAGTRRLAASMGLL